MDAVPQRNTSNWLIYELFFCSILVLILLLTRNTFVLAKYHLISANHCGVNCGPSVVGSEKYLVWFPLVVG